jgi:L-alanine-DL-glutamate epimerase-like enolase superfamily enzyme
VTTTIDAAVGTAAALHLAASLASLPCPGSSAAEPTGPGPALRACGLATLGLLAHPLGHGVPEPRQGVMPLGQGPGLGVRLDHGALGAGGAGR